MKHVRHVTGASLLRLPVRLGNIELGRPVDVVVDVQRRRALGLEVRCGDESHRFLALSVARVGEEEVAVDSPLLLLDVQQVGFYREQASTLRKMRGEQMGEAGTLADIVVGTDGEITDIVVADAEGTRRVPLNGFSLPPADRGRVS
jgi:hypothetical protein